MSLIYPILEYRSVLWEPSSSCGKIMIERVQCKFLSLVSFRFNILHLPHNYSPILHDLRWSQTLFWHPFPLKSHFCKNLSSISIIPAFFQNSSLSHSLISSSSFHRPLLTTLLILLFPALYRLPTLIDFISFLIVCSFLFVIPFHCLLTGFRLVPY